MSFEREASDELKKTLKILKRKDRATFIAIDKKMRQIASCDSIAIEHFKNLRGDRSHLKRVRIGSFVLTFELKSNIIIFEDFCHHKEAYK